MEELKLKYGRRSFLKTSAVAGGGILFSFNFFSSCKEASESAQILREIAREWSEVNGFIKIAKDGFVTIMSPNPEIGQGVKTSMPMIVAEELDVDWDKVIVEQAGLNTTLFTRQVAGGSQSIRRGWDALRTAGATARKMFVQAAAQEWDVPVDECTTEKGIVFHKASNQSKGYGYLVDTISEMEVPETVTLKDPEDFRIIGTDRLNVDGRDIVTGKPLYGLDTRREGMLYASIAHPPAFGQTLVSLDDASAMAKDGVTDVLRFDNNVAVLGTSTWAVFQGKQALNITWQDPDVLENTSDHNNTMLSLLEKPASEPKRKDGDVDLAFSSANRVVESIYECPFLPHNPMAPMNFFADVTDTKAELIGPIQTPERTRSRVATVLGIEEDQVSIMLTRMGGGFGRRLYGDFVLEAAQISQLAKKPIQLVWTREDDMSAGIYRPACKYLFRAALDPNGDLQGYHLRGAGINQNNVTRHNNFPAGAIPHFLAENHRLDSKVTVGAWRAPITNFLAFAEQSFFDEIANVTGKDPIQLRLELFEKAKSNPVGDLSYEPGRFIDVINLVKEKSGWDNPPNGVYQGFSVYYSHNTYVAQVADVIMENDSPKVKKVWCAVDCGIVVNPIGARNQVEGGIIDGIGHAMYGELTISNGAADQKNFDAYRLIRMGETPEVETFFVDNGKSPTGLGEPALPPVAGAVANAIFAATGQRLRKQPFVKSELLG